MKTRKTAVIRITYQVLAEMLGIDPNSVMAITTDNEVQILSVVHSDEIAGAVCIGEGQVPPEVLSKAISKQIKVYVEDGHNMIEFNDHRQNRFVISDDFHPVLMTEEEMEKLK